MLVALFLLVAVGLTDERKFALRGLTKKGLLLRRLTGIHFHVFNSECTSSWIYQFAELPSVPPRSGGHRKSNIRDLVPSLPQTWKWFFPILAGGP